MSTATPTGKGWIVPRSIPTMQHDIYRLGVCLLGVGLWESFVEYTNQADFHGLPQAKFGKVYYNVRN